MSWKIVSYCVSTRDTSLTRQLLPIAITCVAHRSTITMSRTSMLCIVSHTPPYKPFSGKLHQYHVIIMQDAQILVRIMVPSQYTVPNMHLFELQSSNAPRLLAINQSACRAPPAWPQASLPKGRHAPQPIGSYTSGQENDRWPGPCPSLL